MCGAELLFVDLDTEETLLVNGVKYKNNLITFDANTIMLRRHRRYGIVVRASITNASFSSNTSISKQNKILLIASNFLIIIGTHSISSIAASNRRVDVHYQYSNAGGVLLILVNNKESNNGYVEEVVILPFEKSSNTQTIKLHSALEGYYTVCAYDIDHDKLLPSEDEALYPANSTITNIIGPGIFM